MTRLKTEWIENIRYEAEDWDNALRDQTGAGLCELALRGSGTSRKEFEKAKKNCPVGVVSITGGQGVIGTFAESVASIVSAMGFTAEVAEKTDVNGFYEACSRGAHVVFMADDNRFLAVNLTKKALGENDRSTARGYVEALEGMMEKRGNVGLKGQTVLLLGYGRVGREIEKYLLEKEARLVIYDKDEDIRRKILAQGKVFLEKIEDMKRYELIMDATSTGPWITTDMLHKDVFIAAPGIPFSLDEETREDFQGRWVHDNLPIGTAVMLAYALGEEDGK